MGISITGMVSQLDTAKMVSDLMNIERIPYKNLETKRTNLQKEQAIFRNINTAFRSLETALNNLRYASDWNQLKGISSNTNALKISTDNTVQKGEYDINVKQLATKNVVQIDGAHLISKMQPGSKINIGDLEIDYDSISGNTTQDKLKNIANIINATNSGAKATASVIKTSSNDEYSLVLNAQETGSSNAVNFSLKDQSGSAILLDNDKVTQIEGKDAELTINGATVTRSSNEIKDLIDGATLTLTGTGQSTVSVGMDTEGIVSKVKEFVTAYNNLIGMVKDNLKKPEAEGVMNPLQGDSLLRQINDQLYNIFNAGVAIGGTEPRSFMEQIGLSIDKGITKGSLMTGKIKFDEEMFKNALADDSSKVIELFTQNETQLVNGKKSAGVITQFTSIINNYTSTVNGLLSNKVTGYDSEIKFVDQRLETMTRSLEMKEARLKLQFSTMETMLSTLQNEQKWLSSQFDSLSKSNSK